MRIFLGGTCNGSSWRNRLIPMLKIDYFNPVVKNWTPERQEEEICQRENCDFVLYCITPKMTGVYSIAEVVDGSNKRPEKTILCIPKEYCDTYFGNLIEQFTVKQINSLNAVCKMVEDNGAKVFNELKEVANYVNDK